MTNKDFKETRWRRFRGVRRSYYSLLTLIVLIFLSFFAELWIGKRALLVFYKGRLFLPVYGKILTGKTFGLPYEYETNYRKLKAELKERNDGWLLLPLVPWGPQEIDFEGGDAPPFSPNRARGHWLGTDIVRRDILARVVYGFRIAIIFALVTVVLCYAIGIFLGCLMGYLGGWFDLLFQRLIEILSMMPTLYIIMILVSIFQPQFWIFLLIFISFGWMGITWYMRTMAYKERESDYVLAAKTMGASPFHIIKTHIFPNVIVMIITVAPFSLVGAITGLTALDYLGLGLPKPTPSWGELLKMGVDNLGSLWILTSVITALSGVLIMLTFIGEGIREAFDPRKYTRYE